MKGGEKHFYKFKSFRLDVEERRLLHHNAPVSLTPKAFDVLALLVERNGHLVEKDELLESVWADSFVEEHNIARAIHTLRKTLGEDENSNKFIETVAKKGYRFVAKVTEVCEADKQQSAAAVGSQDDAIEELPTANRQLPIAGKPKQNTRIILFAVGFLSAVFLILLMSFNFQSDSATSPNKIKSIAVLPVNPVNAANRDDIYDIGIAESLITRLGAMKGLLVRPLGATRKYADINQDPLAAGREQKVDYVLAANYQIADGKIRVTAQLFNVATGQIEETYKTEKDAGNIFALQDTIAGEVGNLLQTRFAVTANNPTARRGTTNEEAYRLYLQGRNLTMKRNDADARKAVEYLEQAIRLDPNFALAYAQMAHAYRRANFGGDGEYEKIKKFINKALELDPNLAEAYVARADGYLLNEWNFAAVEKDLAKAIELEPNNDAAHWLNSLLLAYRGRFDEALISIETAQTIDPGALMYMRDRGRILYYARRYDEAIAQLNRVIDLDKPFGTQFSNWLISAYEMKGNHAAAYETFITLQKQKKSERVEIYQQIYAADGWQAVRRKQIEFAKLNGFKVEDSFFNLTRISAQLGEKDAAFEYLNKAVETRGEAIIMLNVDPPLDPLRDDPRFAEVVRRVGLK